MKINKITKKNLLNKIIFIIIGLIIIALFSYTFFILKDIKQISNNIYQARLELEKKYLAGITLKKNSEQLTKLKPRLKQIDKSIIKYENNLSFINDLENEADKLDLQLDIKIPEVKLENKEITASPIQLTVTGKMEAALKYLEILDKKNYYLNFTDIRLTNISTQQANNESNITLTMQGKIYWD